MLMLRQDVPDTERAVLLRCRRHASSGRYAVSQVAFARSQAAGLSPVDVRQILSTAESCRPATTPGTWTIRGRTMDDLEGEALVAFDPSGLTVL